MVTLVIMDGFGLSKKKKGNAIKLAKTPMLDKLKKAYSFAELDASGEAVGLENGQMGNSEVGHLNMGAGRVVGSDLYRINNDIKNKTFANNAAFNVVFDHVQKHSSKLHIIGLVSSGGVHSHINHLIELVNIANEKGIKEIFIHAILDGRDTDRQSGLGFIQTLKKHILGKAEIKSVIGRVYAMDRENRFDRVEKAYNMLALNRAENYHYDAEKAIQESYQNGIFDEFMEPCIIGEPKNIDRNDGVIFFNFRSDRARELTSALTQDFTEFETKNIQNLCFCTMTEYDNNFKNIQVAYKKQTINDNLSAIISQNGLNQFHTSETTKYAHVTYFFNGGIEQKYSGEDRKLIESQNVVDFSKTPKMKAYEITDAAINAIATEKYSFVVVNLSNLDMLGHTGNLEKTMEAVRVVDKCAYTIALATLMAGGDCLITADHGNAEVMIKNKKVCTTHTCNKVPLYLISQRYNKVKLDKNRGITAIAPTILKLLDLEKPKTMEYPLF